HNDEPRGSCCATPQDIPWRALNPFRRASQAASMTRSVADTRRLSAILGLWVRRYGSVMPDIGGRASRPTYRTYTQPVSPKPDRHLKTQPRVFVSTLRALRQLYAAGGGIKRVATDAVKRHLAPLELEAPVIPSIVVQPDAEKQRGDEDAV